VKTTFFAIYGALTAAFAGAVYAGIKYVEVPAGITIEGLKSGDAACTERKFFIDNGRLKE